MTLENTHQPLEAPKELHFQEQVEVAYYCCVEIRSLESSNIFNIHCDYIKGCCQMKFTGIKQSLYLLDINCLSKRYRVGYAPSHVELFQKDQHRIRIVVET